MSNYRYGDVISMQEAAIQRVNEMQRRAREAARLANEELSGGTLKSHKQGGEKSNSRSAGSSQKPAGHTNLPVDYLHNGSSEGASVRYYPQSRENRPENTGSAPAEKEPEIFHSASADSGKVRPDTAKKQNSRQGGSKEKNSGSAKNSSPSHGADRNMNHNSWAQAAVNRQQKQGGQNHTNHISGAPQYPAPHNIRKSDSQILRSGDNGIFSALGSIAGKTDSDTILLLSLMYILWRDGADYGLLFALFYILM